MDYMTSGSCQTERFRVTENQNLNIVQDYLPEITKYC